MQQFIDENNRIINYLRISVTDRCNLRCIYCVGGEDFDYKPHDEILTYEEILHLAKLFIQHGIRKIRITGGEPLVRKGLLSFLQRLNRLPGLDEISLTTNGVLLEQFASQIKSCGIRRLNVSMDTLKRERYAAITKRDYFDQVWRGIDKAERVGFHPIKINVVVMKGVNDDEIVDFVRLAKDKPYHIRFIEFMPVGDVSGWTEDKFISVDLLKEKVLSLASMELIESGVMEGPAQRYKLAGGKGEIGFIGAISHHFCSTCNRLRLTAGGKLRSCLFSDQEFDLKKPLRQGREDSYLLKIMQDAVSHKPRGHNLHFENIKGCNRRMVKIGG